MFSCVFILRVEKLEQAASSEPAGWEPGMYLVTRASRQTVTLCHSGVCAQRAWGNAKGRSYPPFTGAFNFAWRSASWRRCGCGSDCSTNALLEEVQENGLACMVLWMRNQPDRSLLGIRFKAQFVFGDSHGTPMQTTKASPVLC